MVDIEFDLNTFALFQDGEPIGEIFQDEASQAAILMHRDPDGSYLLVSYLLLISTAPLQIVSC